MPAKTDQRALNDALQAVSGDRIAARITELARIGGLADGGVSRLGLTPEEQQARDRVAAWLAPLGYDRRHDDALNLFCATGEAPRVLVGSHLDSVPDGGRFDGALGVVCAVEIAEAAQAAALSLPLEIVAWSDEEGARFGTGLFGSAAAFGRLPPSAWERRDAQGASVSDAAGALLGRAPNPVACQRSLGEIRAYLELHIEQGPRLAERKLPVGIVSHITGLSHGCVRLTGRSDHAGTTPMDARADSLAAAAECVLAVERIARQSRGQLVGTVGEISVAPGAKNVVAGTCTFSLDLRSTSDAVRQEAVRRVAAVIKEVATRRTLQPGVDMYNDVPAAAMSYKVVSALDRAATQLGISPLHLPSGAGHDAQNAATAGVPTGMVFVRSTGGSHNPGEHAASEDAAQATRLLLLAVVSLSQG